MNNEIQQYQSRLFNKLFASLPSIRKFSKITNKFNLDEEITHFYAYGNQKFWFAKGEKEKKIVYLFGLKNKSLKDITESDASLIIDFDKDKQFNNTSLGMFRVKNSEIHILINYTVLKKRYPYFNTGNFKITEILSIDTRQNYKVIDLGSLSEEFIENLEKLIKLSSVLELFEDEEEEPADLNNNEKPPKRDSNQCAICEKNKDNFKINSELNNLKNLKPELCGRCIEKIVASEFYTKLSPLLKGNESKDLDIAKEKYGNDQIFDIGVKLLEKYGIINYIGVKKLFFTIDKNSYLVTKYLEYSEKDNLLLDNIEINEASVKKNKNVDMRDTNLTRKTKNKMNLFLNALQSGKTHEEAYKISRVSPKQVENWYHYGKKGEFNYIPFYNSYKKFHHRTMEKMEKMETFLDSLKNDQDLDYALKKSNLTIGKVKAWYNLGEKGDDEYQNFYIACKILLPEGIIQRENEKIVNNEDLMNEFIALIEDGKTNEQAIETLKIPKFKIKNWFNQGKLGNKKYIEFYDAYMIQINKQKNAEKENMKPKIEVKEEILEETQPNPNEKVCEICGRKINKKRTSNICKRCSRKQYASKILIKLLSAIEPEKEFKKEDLKILGLQKIQITDYIWTLQEFNLIEQKNNRIKLKNRKILDEFIEESGIEIDEIETTTSNVSLNKVCKKCGETLEISKFFTSDKTEDGFEEYCKDCKKLVNAATYLKEIHEHVDYGNEFTENELLPIFKDYFKLQAKIWSLVDNNLARKNFENNTYILTDKKTAEEFLENYYEETETVEEPEKNIKQPKKSSKKNQMSIIIKAISEGKTRKEAAEMANIPLYKITHWYNEGRQGYGNENTNFYKQLRDLENINLKNQKDLKNKMDDVLDELRAGKQISDISSANEDEINEWMQKGIENKAPYDYFLEEYDKIIVNNKEATYYENAEINRKIFFENFKNGKTKEESAKNAELDLSLVHEWYLKGKNNEEPYVEFYDKYMSIKNSSKKTIPRLKKENKFGTSLSVSQMNIILENLAKGVDEKEAVEKADISFDTYKYWINRGKQKFGELYTQFYQYVTEIKNGKYDDIANNNIDPDIYAPLPKEYESSFKSSTMNKSGIAWVNISSNGKKWIYTKNLNGKYISFDDEDIYELHKKVKQENHVWGIRDYERARKIIDIPDDFEIPTHISNNAEDDTPKEIKPEIYSPLPQKYLETFPKQSNQTGIAWVNKIGNQFIYSRNINGKTMKISDEDIYRLYEKVINNNQIWGIRNYTNARKFIDIPDNFEIPNNYQNNPFDINTDIFAPLSKEHVSKFNPNMKNKTGIAWVNKVGNNWIYQRQVKGNLIKFKSDNIHELHQIILDNNQIWGIIDYNKAKHIIDADEKNIKSQSEQIDKIDVAESISTNVTVNYIKTSENNVNVLIKGTIKNNELINILTRLNIFEEKIKRIVTTSLNQEVDIFIELEIGTYQIKTFEEKIEDLKWNILKLF